MGEATGFKELLRVIADRDQRATLVLLDEAPSLATYCLARRDEFFLAERGAQMYEGDTALHAAAFSYDSEAARVLLARGADIRARNRRGAEFAIGPSLRSRRPRQPP